MCGGIGHPARLCPSEGWVNDLEQDTPEGEDTNEEGCWTEEDDETLQLGYLGSESCLMSSPPGLRDACSEAGWTVVTRKSRNDQQCSRRRWCYDKRGTVLGSLWDDDNDMILGQVADDRTRKGMVKISAVVDSGAEANALPKNMMQWIPLKHSSASKSGKIFRGAGGDPINARGEGSVTGRTEQGQSRRIVWEVGPVKRPLLSAAKITKAGNQVYLGEDKAFVKNNKTEQITNLRRERNVWMLDLWVKRPADAKDVSSFQFSEAGPLRTCAGTTVTTMGPVPVRPLLAPVDEESAQWRMTREERMSQCRRGRRPMFRKSENQPSSQEVQEHMKTRIPYRSWCAHCVSGRESNFPHRTRGGRRGPTCHPHLAIDHAFLKANNLNDPADQGSNPILMGAERSLGSLRRWQSMDCEARGGLVGFFGQSNGHPEV